MKDEMYQDISALKETVPNIKWYVNMTNGIEAIPILEELNIPFSFVNIQSTHLEQKHINLMMRGLGADFLMNLAIGKECVVIDYGAQKKNSRAIYQGLPLIKYICERSWFDDFDLPFIISRNGEDKQGAQKLFEEYYHTLDKKTKRYISRYKSYSGLNLDRRVKLKGLSQPTYNDNNSLFYKEIVEQFILLNRKSPTI